MFVIFGYGPRVKDRGPDRFRTCRHCHNHAQWRLNEVTHWVTLFFIPVLPLNRRTRIQCPICGFGWEVGGGEPQKEP